MTNATCDDMPRNMFMPVARESIAPLLCFSPSLSTQPGKLVATLDRCQLSIKDSACILQTVVEALGLNCDKFLINRSSTEKIRTQLRKTEKSMISNV